MRATTVLLGCWLWLQPSHARVPAHAPEVRQLLENARYWTERNRPDLARQSMRKLLAIHPHHPEARQALGLAPSQAPKTDATKKRSLPTWPSPAVRKITAQHPEGESTSGPSPAAHADAVDIGTGQEVALAVASTADETAEHGPAPLDLEQAMRPATQVLPLLQAPPQQPLEHRQQPQWATGVTLVHKQGDGAVSRLDSQVASFQLRQPWRDHGHWFARLDTVRLDAGRANTTNLSQTGDWGSAALLHASSQNGISMHAQAQGAALIAGYEADHWRADVGTTPVGFEFSGLSAGLGLQGRMGSVAWSVSLAHRPVTDSLLSYGGQRDLFSGTRWGAVRRTSALLHLSTVWKAWEPFAQLEEAAYRGRGVLSNREQAAALGVDWVWSRGANHHLVMGPALRFRAFDNNQNHYSVGHGGYYSPQSNTTVSFPVQATARSENLSWWLRVAPSWSHSSTAAAPRFPTRADLQAQAVAQGKATYGSTRGPGNGWALQGTWEYRMNAHWVTGFRWAAERSPDYARDQIHLYLRWHEKPQRGPVSLWPAPLVPHAGI